jgi:hypothetical protein
MLIVTHLQSRPIFKAPVARTSLLGLDKLAQQKREAEAAKTTSDTKKIKLDYAEDVQDEPMAESNICKFFFNKRLFIASLI